MHKTTFLCVSAVAAATLFVAGCASTGPTQASYSGFMTDYSNLQETKDVNGETILRYVNPKLTPANYSAVIVDPITFYPKAEPTEQLSQATLDEIRNYSTTCLRQAISSRTQVVDKPGPGVGCGDAASSHNRSRQPGRGDQALPGDANGIGGYAGRRYRGRRTAAVETARGGAWEGQCLRGCHVQSCALAYR